MNRFADPIGSIRKPKAPTAFSLWSASLADGPFTAVLLTEHHSRRPFYGLVNDKYLRVRNESMEMQLELLPLKSPPTISCPLLPVLNYPFAYLPSGYRPYSELEYTPGTGFVGGGSEAEIISSCSFAQMGLSAAPAPPRISQTSSRRRRGLLIEAVIVELLDSFKSWEKKGRLGWSLNFFFGKRFECVTEGFVSFIIIGGRWRWGTI